MNLDRPPAFTVPDRADWLRRYGLEPYDLPTDGHEDLVLMASDYFQRDWQTLDATEAHQLHAVMDGICAGMAARLGLDALIFFDGIRQVFVLYPFPAFNP